ncbi:MAG: tetratricopeptide repeat protein [Gammaproteobacteria bacterium]
MRNISLNRTIVLTASLLFGPAPSWPRTGPSERGPRADSLATIVSRHIEALGGLEQLHAIKDRVVRGSYREGTDSFTTYIAQSRPFYRTLTDPALPNNGGEGYDGSAWEYYPDPGIVVRTVGAAAAATRHTAMFDDVLVDADVKGTTLVLRESRIVAGHPVFVIRATLADGFERDVFVNTSTYMIDGDERVVSMHAFGANRRLYELYSDYRRVSGVMFPFHGSEVDADSNKVIDEGFVTSVEFNGALPVSMFSPPDFERTPLQQMIQKIYDEREDSAAVISTYRNYRPLVTLGKATSDAVDFAGYQCLKMGHIRSAVGLLTLNVADSPGSARAHFGLGRALQSANRLDEAKAEMRRTLEIDPNFVRARKALDALK